MSGVARPAPVPAAVLDHQDRLLELIASGTAPAAILEQLAVSLESLLAGGRCSILLVTDDGRTLRHGAAPNLPGEYCAAIDGMAIGAAAGSCGTAAHLGRLVVVRDVRADSRWIDFRALADAHGLRACWSSPVTAPDGVVLGTFAVYHAEPHEPTAPEVALLERFSGLAAVAIRHADMLRALNDSEERFRRAFDDNVAGMALIDLDGRLVRVNRAFCAVTGRAEGGLRGRRFVELVRAEDQAAAADAVARLSSAPSGGRQVELRIARPTGEEAFALVAVSLVHDADGRPRHGCVNIIDDTVRRRAEMRTRAAEAARAAAEQRSVAQGQLLSAISHELRTPMSSIVGFSELLRTVALEPERREQAVAHLTESAQHMLGLVEDLLELAKLDAGVVEIQRVVCDLRAVVAEAAAVLEPLAAEHGVAVHLPEGGRPIAVQTDRRRLRQALINVIGNAIKFNHAGGSVELELVAAGDRVRLLVHDTGRGLPPARDGLFAPYDRLGAEGSEVPGTGLGLAISKQFLEAMAGALAIGDRPGGGTTVVVELPAAAQRVPSSVR